MATVTYFDLKDFRSLMIKTQNGKYHFKKGQPLKVEFQEDIDRFRNEIPLFEVDEDGNRVTIEDKSTVNSREFRRFREANINLPEDPEELLKKVYNETVQKRESEGVDVKKLLDEVNNDTINKEAVAKPVEEVKVEIVEAEEVVVEETVAEIQHKKVKQKKKATECEKCGRNFKSKAELEKHLEDHEDEE